MEQRVVWKGTKGYREKTLKLRIPFKSSLTLQHPRACSLWIWFISCILLIKHNLKLLISKKWIWIPCIKKFNQKTNYLKEPFLFINKAQFIICSKMQLGWGKARNTVCQVDV